MATEVATLAGGCFWCLEAVFDQFQGVESVESGYMGGHSPNPSYEEICAGSTGHAEVVRVTFDPAVVGFRDLLAVFFTIHDPTTPNRQGNDVGTQYRSAIFFHSEEQRRAAVAVKARVGRSGFWKKPIVTEVVPASVFHLAEDYHQDYLQKHPDGYTCHYLRE